MMDKGEAVAKVNNVFEYQYDSDQYQVADYWRVLDMSQDKDQGDCEDYALTVGWMLADQSPMKFLWMILTKKIKICFISYVDGGHAVLEYEGLLVDNWKKEWTPRSIYEKDYAQYKWEYKFYYNPLVVVKKLIQGKFWKK